MAEQPVLIAHDSAEMAAEIEQALRDIAGRLTVVKSGEEALSHLVREHPGVLVVDVALPGRAPFELCDDIRQAGLRTRVVLVASVYKRTRYKRRPTSLYGADDYVEQHHIHDMLPEKVKVLLSGVGSSADVPHGEVDPVAAARVRDAADAAMTIQFESVDEGLARAGRLCNLIVADVILYNGSAFETMRNFSYAPARLLDDLQEAREIFAKLVPAEIRGDRDWVGKQFAELLERRPPELAPRERSCDG